MFSVGRSTGARDRGKGKMEDSLTPSSSLPSTSTSSPLPYVTDDDDDDDAPLPGSQKIYQIQFFVRPISRSTLVVRARSSDTVESVIMHIWLMTGINPSGLRLLYRNRQLRNDATLSASGVESDSTLHVVGRLRSTMEHRVWRFTAALISAVRFLELSPPLGEVDSGLVDWFKIPIRRLFRAESLETSKSMTCLSFEALKFVGAPQALVELYLSGSLTNKHIARVAIDSFLSVDAPRKEEFVPLLLIFLKRLESVGCRDDHFYRKLQRLLLDIILTASNSGHLIYSTPAALVHELEPLIRQQTESLLVLLRAEDEPDLDDILKEFSLSISAIEGAIRACTGNVWDTGDYSRQLKVHWVSSLHELSTELWNAVDGNLKKIEDLINKKGFTDDTYPERRCSQIASIITGIVRFWQAIGKSRENIHEHILAQRVPLNFIFSLARRDRSFQWFLAFKDVTHFKARRNLVLTMFKERTHNGFYVISIDRSSLLKNSYEIFQNADLSSLCSELHVTFNHEEAIGPGVMKEWLCLLCQEIFNPHLGLFSSCQYDKHRFFPSESAREYYHLRYFGFSGRVIALALTYEIQVGIVFDRTFFLRLAGEPVTLEDVKVADPMLYSSCQRILDMDAESLDSDALKLTFSRDIECQGSRKTIELVPGGKEIAVNSKNKEQYVDLLIRSRFVTSISTQVTCFAIGFADILAEREKQQCFFRSLALEDLDWMLGGSSSISVMDWKTHTGYSGYTKEDDQICWFWEVNLKVISQDVLFSIYTSNLL
ncbi:E3 ubiquitin-protein ligase UPL5-like [Typha latifolia]|uniref:E3 ubiquitin-protein ligase UPL5-like n=1 Tax=Typha latifolia TaxID=4733 RepID=UPI003C2FC137